MPAPPPNFVWRRVCRASCIATARTCVRHLPGNLLAAVRRILFFVLERRSTLSVHQQKPQPFLHAYPWRSPKALLSAPPAVASRRRVLASRVSYTSSRPTSGWVPWLSLVRLRPCCLDGCLSRLTRARLIGHSRVNLVTTNALHLLTSCLGAQLGVQPPASVVIPMPAIPQAEQFLFIVVHEFLHFTVHVACSFVFCSHGQSHVSSNFPSSVPTSSTPAHPLSVALPLLGQLDVPMYQFVPCSRLRCLSPCTVFAAAFQLVVRPSVCSR